MCCPIAGRVSVIELSSDCATNGLRRLPQGDDEDLGIGGNADIRSDRHAVWMASHAVLGLDLLAPEESCRVDKSPVSFGETQGVGGGVGLACELDCQGLRLCV